MNARRTVIDGINFTTTDEDAALIEKILDRAQAEGFMLPQDRLTTEMDIKACHLNGTPLRLAVWLAADWFDFLHDLVGITRRMDRTTGRLTGHFLPRFHV